MSTKFNIYYATSANGPWTLVNTEPLDRVADGNTYTISGLQENTSYFVNIVGGIINTSDEFVPLINKPCIPTIVPVAPAVTFC